MIHSRRLTRQELNRLLAKAPDDEVRNLFSILREVRMDAYDFFDKYAVEHFGILSDEKPLYVGILTRGNDSKFDLWTVVNSNVREQFSLYKLSKKEIKRIADKYKQVYATMEKNNLKNQKWVRRLGFEISSEDDKTITYCIRGG